MCRLNERMSSTRETFDYLRHFTGEESAKNANTFLLFQKKVQHDKDPGYYIYILHPSNPWVAASISVSLGQIESNHFICVEPKSQQHGS